LISGPLFVRWPGRIEPGTRSERLAGHVDLMPTLASAARAPLPGCVEIDGIDLLDPAAARRHDAIFWQSGYYRAVRQGNWKLQLSEKPKRIWLFDLAGDPIEQTNLAEREPGRWSH